MTLKFRQYGNEPGYSKDYHKVRDFLIRINKKEFVCINYLWERWEWSFALQSISRENLSKMGMWEDNGKLVGVAAIEDTPGEMFPFIDKEYAYLKKDVLLYSIKNLSKDGKFRVLIQDNDPQYQKIAGALCFCPSQNKDPKSVLDIKNNNLTYELPEGFKACSLVENFDIYKYNRVLWRGFNHEGEAPSGKDEIESRKFSLSGPNQDLALNIAVVSPEGEYVSYCGMWYDKTTDYALVEPVATDPDYRKLGLGRAAVLEGIKRCSLLGAKTAYVGSAQQFYYKIGFRPVVGGTFWDLS